MIKGQHTALRAIEREDLPSLLSWRNDPELRRYFREYRELNFQQQINYSYAYYCQLSCSKIVVRHSCTK